MSRERNEAQVMRTRRAAEGGFTLVEVLVALSIVSFLVIGSIAGMSTMAMSTGTNRNLGAVGAVVRRAAEAVRGDAYVACNSLAANAYPLGMPAQASSLPENVGATRVQLPFVAKITTFDGQTTLWTPQNGVQNCTGNANAIQVVQVEDDAASGPVKQTINVVKAPTS
jgi:prepilin-type N-terminal cleavage/methylation domain-containing protein